MCGPENLELLIVSLCKANFKLCLGVFYRPSSLIPRLHSAFQCCTREKGESGRPSHIINFEHGWT